jgi:hypothetical protein
LGHSRREFEHSLQRVGAVELAERVEVPFHRTPAFHFIRSGLSTTWVTPNIVTNFGGRE